MNKFNTLHLVTDAQFLPGTAQMALIQRQSGVTGDKRVSVLLRQQTQLPPQVGNQLSHPYYWVLFILIGNGL